MFIDLCSVSRFYKSVNFQVIEFSSEDNSNLYLILIRNFFVQFPSATRCYGTLTIPTYDVLAKLKIMFPIKFFIYNVNGEILGSGHKDIDLLHPARTPLEECCNFLSSNLNPNEREG